MAATFIACLLGAVALGAVGTSAAEAKGTALFTCKPVSEGGGSTQGFSDAHCKTAATGSSVKYEHIDSPISTTTEVSVSNSTTGVERSTALFESKVLGETALQIAAKSVQGTGTIETRKTAAGDHYIVGALTLEYLEAEVTKPAGKGCKVAGNTIVLNELISSKEQGDFLNLSLAPAVGIAIEGCSDPTFNGTKNLTGSLKSKVQGATVVSTHSEVTSQETLKLKGTATGLEGSLTFSGRTSTSESFTPITATTLETTDPLPSPAEPEGTTGFTCKPVSEGGGGTLGFSDAHCTTAATGGGVRFEHISIAEGHATEASVSNSTTGTGRSTIKLESKQAGIAEQISAKVVQGVATMENKSTVGGEHYVEGTGTLKFQEVEVTRPPGKGCKVKGGEIATKELVATTKEQGDFLKIAPASGSVLAEFAVEGCTTAALNGSYSVQGSLKTLNERAATIGEHAEVTTQGTLFVREQTAGLDGAFTLSGREGGTGEYTALSATTVETVPPTKGTTAFTCGPESQPNSKAGFSKSHCKPGDAVGTNAGYVHVAVGEATSTEAIASNKNTAAGTESSTPFKLRATTAGIDTEFQATGVSGSGFLENMKDASSGEHTISGTGTVTFSGLTVAKPEGKGCKVKGGEVKTKELKATTSGQGDAVKFEPASGTLLASFEVEGCSTEALNGTFEVKGSIKGTADGATISFTEEASTVQNTMTMRAVPAGLEGTVTIAGRTKGSGSNYTDLSPTTVETQK